LHVGSKYYPPNIYNSWDPNWRGFVATVFIMCLEEFPTLLTPKVTALLLESLHNATVGDSYRVGGVDNDNLYPAYSNPVGASYIRLILIPSSDENCIVAHESLCIRLDRASPE
jgi:hypothetical protein